MDKNKITVIIVIVVMGVGGVTSVLLWNMGFFGPKSEGDPTDNELWILRGQFLYPQTVVTKIQGLLIILYKL